MEWRHFAFDLRARPEATIVTDFAALRICEFYMRVCCAGTAFELFQRMTVTDYAIAA